MSRATFSGWPTIRTAPGASLSITYPATRRCALLLGFVLLCLPSTSPAVQAAQPSTEIHGHVVDARTLAPVSLVQVSLVGTSLQWLTGRDGEFIFTNIEPGTYSLRAFHISYNLLVRDNVRVEPGAVQTIELSLTPKVFALEAIVVTPGAFSFMDVTGSAHQTMTREDIESVPQLGEDIFRAVNRLPGLSSGDYSAHFSIRGGRHDETLILLDGLELYEPYHLKDFNEGAISIVDADMIERVELLTGGFPAKFGNKRSGVFDITTRTPRLERPRFSAGLSFINARAAAMGPLRGGKGSWLASARSGYLDLVFKLIKQNDLPSPRYHDVFAKLQYDLGTNHVLSFNVLHAGDKYTFDAAATTGFRDTLDTREDAENRYGNSYVWTTLKFGLGDRTSVTTMASAGLVTRNRTGSERYIDLTEPIYSLSNERDFSILGVKQDWTFGVSDIYALSFGADFRRFENKDSFTSIVGQDPNDPAEDPNNVYPVTTGTSIERTGTRLGLYLSNRLRIVYPLVIDLGVRYDRASYTGDRDFSPRAGMSLNLGRGATLRAGWGHYRQIQGIDDVVALNKDQSYYASELTEQWTAGLEQRFPNGALLRVEGYLKDGSKLRPVYRNWKGGIDTFPETNEDRILVFPKTTTAKGVEVYFDHDLGKRLAVRASYAYSIAEEEVERIENVNGADELKFEKTHPIPQDQRHAANADFTYRFRRLWSLNGSFVYHSGWPGTLEELVRVIDDDGNPDFSVWPTAIYGARMPDYVRFDVRATRRWTSSWGDLRFFVELVNLTNHSNVFGYDYFKEYDSNGNIVLVRDVETWFTILPSLGIVLSKNF